jgi:hypothetical protein
MPHLVREKENEMKKMEEMQKDRHIKREINKGKETKRQKR